MCSTANMLIRLLAMHGVKMKRTALFSDSLRARAAHRLQRVQQVHPQRDVRTGATAKAFVSLKNGNTRMKNSCLGKDF